MQGYTFAVIVVVYIYYDIQNILWLIIVSAEHSVYILSSYCAHGYSVYLVYMIC
jgi:hypothetical protein